MRQQDTIFMALENQLEQQLQQQQEQQDIIINDNRTTIKCEYCHKQMDKRGYFYIIDNIIRFFHKAYCKYLYELRLKRRQQKIRNIENRLVNCLTCSATFDPVKTRKKKYCSPQCSYKNRPKKKNNVMMVCHYCHYHFEVLPSVAKARRNASKNGLFYCSNKCWRDDQSWIYKDHFWCGICKWVKNEDAILKPRGSISPWGYYIRKRDNYYCKNCDTLLIKKKTKRKKNKNNNNKQHNNKNNNNIPENDDYTNSSHNSNNTNSSINNRSNNSYTTIKNI